MPTIAWSPTTAEHLARHNANLWLLSGDEWVVMETTLDAIRAHYQQQGFLREVIAWPEGVKALVANTNAPAQDMFAAGTLLEVDMPGGKVGTNAKLIKTAIAWLAADVKAGGHSAMLWVASDSGKLKAAWCNAFANNGVHITHHTLNNAGRGAWLKHQLQQFGMTAAREAEWQLLKWYEGNMPALAQTVRVLHAAGITELTTETLAATLADERVHSPFAFADAVLAGDAAKALAIGRQVRADGDTPIMLIWLLAQVVGYALALQTLPKRDWPNAFQKWRIWQQRQGALIAASKKPTIELNRAVDALYLADRQAKGQAAGHPWHTLEQLVATF